MSAPRSHPFGFTSEVGIDGFEALEDGSVRCVLEIEDRHLNRGGIVHGGVLMTLLDSAIGAAVVRTLGEGEWTATASLHTEFMRAAQGTMVGVGRVDRRGKLSAFASGEVLDAEGQVVARASGMWVVRTG